MRPDPLQIRLLGPLEVVRGEEPVELPPSRKARALLAYLASHQRLQPRTSLCDLLWQRVADPRAGLRWALSKLRAALGDGDGAPVMVTTGDRVGIDPARARVDLHTVQGAASRELSGIPTDELHRLASAFRGEFLEGLDLRRCHEYQAWCLGTRERLRGLHVALRGELTTRLRDDPEAALPHAMARLGLDPYAEPAYVAAMDLLGRMGRVDRALEVYERCRRMLSDRLGVEPSEALEASRRRLKGRTRPAAAPPNRDAPPAGPILSTLPHPDGLPPIGPHDPPLVGRRVELAALVEPLRAGGGVRGGGGGARQLHVAGDAPRIRPSGNPGRGRVTLVTGEAGIGKTRLLREMVGAARSEGGWVVSGRVFESEELRPYGPWIDMLRGLPASLLEASRGEGPSGLVGLVGTPGRGIRPDGPTDRTQLFHAVARLLERMVEAQAPGVVVLDDVQWLDPSSAALLHYVVRTLRSTPLVLALGARDTEIAPGSPVHRVLRSLEEEGDLLRIPLDRLGPSDTEVLVRAVDGGLDPAEVFTTSEGNPLFTLAVAASLREGGSGVPTSLEEVLDRHLDRLDPPARALLPWAAALGRAFDLPTLIRVVDRPAHEIVDAVDALERRRILRPTGADRFDFSHDLVRQAAYRGLSEPARRAIHRRVAEALDAPDGTEVRLPGAVAHHAELGGLPERSIRACIEAAEDSFWVFALDEAAELVERGLRQLEHLPADARIRHEMGLLRIHSFRGMRERRPAGMEARVRRVIEEARRAGLLDVISLGHALLMELQYQRGAFQEAEESSVRSAEAGRHAGAERAIRSLSETAACLLLLDQAPEDARRLASEAFAVAEEHGVDSEVVALARALLHHHDGELEPASLAFREVIRLGRRARDRWWECPALTRMVMVELDRGAHGTALLRAREAEELAERMDDGEEAAFARGLGAVAEVLPKLDGRETDDTGAPGVPGAPDATDAPDAPDLSGIDRALAELRTLDNLWKVAHVQAWAAEIELTLGRPDAARIRAEETLRAARALQRPSLLALGRALLALCGDAEAQPEEAARHLESPEITHPPHRLSHRARRVVGRAREALSE
jgi:DNA-binding SARP family transcriptional activator/tetratricopeptide (TPR) repeat protein